MANPQIMPKAMTVCIVVLMRPEVGGFLVKIHQQLLIDAQTQAANFVLQYKTMAVIQVTTQEILDPTKSCNNINIQPTSCFF